VNYKNIIKDQKIRFWILGFLKFVPDKLMIKIQYKIKTGHFLNLTNPKRYTEKLQWYKLYYRDPIFTKCSDKYDVRQYIEKKGLASILNTLHGVYERIEDIQFDELPKSFAIKHTNGSGENIFVQDKSLIDMDSFKSTLRSWLNKKRINYGREWGYDNVPSRLIVEALIERDENNDIPDYKFFCFNGKVEYLYTMVDYVDDHKNGRCSFFTPDFVQLPYCRSEYKAINRIIPKPVQFNEMVKIAEKLSEGFPHVRVDLYNIREKIIFGELTFYNASGYTVFTPDEFDFILGEKFIIPKRTS
jgi:hypothetical protein